MIKQQSHSPNRIWGRSRKQHQSGTITTSLALSFLLVTPSVQASDELPAFTESDLFADIPEITSATRLSQKLTETPAAITIIDREQIEASAATKISDLLRLVPGMQAYHVSHNKSAASYHGLSDDFPGRMEVMVDGRSIYIPLLSTVIWETIGISLDDIERIEVVRGSNVPSQGSNAFLGSINIITQSPLTPASNSAQIMSGYQGEKRAELRHTLFGEAGNLRMSAGFSKNDGSKLYKDEANNRYLNLSAASTLSLKNSVNVQLGFSSGKTDLAESDKLDNSTFLRDHDSNYQQLTWNHAASDEHEFKLSFSHSYLKLNIDEITIESFLEDEESVQEQAQLLGLDLSFAAALYAQMNGLDGTSVNPHLEHGSTEQYDIELQHSLYASESLRVVTGLGYHFEQAKSSVLFDTDNWISEEQTRAFTNIEWHQTQQLTWNAGAMYEATSLADSRLSPRLAANYRVDEGSSFRAAYTQAYRMPSLLKANAQTNIRQNEANNYEIFDQLIASTPGLEPEKINSAELGFYKIIPSTETQFDLRIFHERISNAIDSTHIILPDNTDRDDRVISHANVMDWENQGFEFQVKAKPQPNTLILLNYSHVDAEGEYLKKQNQTINLNLYEPGDTASLLVSHTTNNQWQFSLAHYVMGGAAWLEGTSANAPLKAYQRTDLQIRKQLNLANNTDAEIKLVVQNLFDDRYQEFYPYNYFDRRTYMEFKLRY
ncbi:MAG: TonB-dependent receptor plug domain-containing protein [Pontibacterium sp.]